MKRAILVSAGTVAGIAGVLVMNPEAPTAKLTASAATGTTPTDTASAAPASTKQTVQGDSVMTRYGALQLEVTVENGTITDITELAMPSNDGRSMMISQQAGPMLRKQALAANSANIAGVSGATFTTMGYQQSLQSALDQLGM